MELESVTRKWGSSLGVVIPKEVVEQEHLHKNEPVVISVRKKHTAEHIFGLLAGWKRSTDEIKREMKAGWN